MNRTIYTLHNAFADARIRLALAIGILGITGAVLFPTAANGVVAGSVALCIAFVAYPWQRAKDNEVKSLEEKRTAYRDFLTQIQILKGHVANGAKDAGPLYASLSAYDVLALYADPETLQRAYKCIGYLYLLRASEPEIRAKGLMLSGWHVVTRDDLEVYLLMLERDLLAQMRVDLLHEDIKSATDALGLRYYRVEQFVHEKRMKS